MIENGTHRYQVCQVALCFPCDVIKLESEPGVFEREAL